METPRSCCSKYGTQQIEYSEARFPAHKGHKGSDVEIEPVLQNISGQQLGRDSKRGPDARLDIHMRAGSGRTNDQHSLTFTLMLIRIGT